MSGWSSVSSRLKHLGKKAIVAQRANQTSVVYFDEVDGERVIDWPDNPNASGVLCVPRSVSQNEWLAQQW